MSSASAEVATSTYGQKTKQVPTLINIHEPKPTEPLEDPEDDNTDAPGAQVENMETTVNDEDNEEEESNNNVTHGTKSVNSSRGLSSVTGNFFV